MKFSSAVSSWQKAFLTAALLLLGFSLGACDRNKEKTVKHLHVLPNQTSASLFAVGQKHAANRKYEDAIEYFDAVKNNFPYSKEALDAELNAADSYFNWKQYGQSAAGYESFRKLHPTHEKADYAMMRQAESYYFDAPKTIDRDLTYCRRAIEVADNFFRMYPASEHVTKARDITFQCQQRLAGQEFYVGRFYYRRHEYPSSISRLEGVLKDHAGFGYDDKAAWYLGLAYLKRREKDKALVVFQKLKERYPDSKYGKKAAKKIQRLKG